MFFNAVAERSSPIPADSIDADSAAASLAENPAILADAPCLAITPAMSFALAFE